MYSKFSGSVQGQYDGFFRYLRSRPAALKALQKKDFRGAARYYNGPGQIDYYSRQIEDVYNKLRKLE